MKAFQVLTTVLVAGLLTGCSVGLGARVESGGGPRYFTPGPEAQVVIREDIALPPRQLRAYFQDGRQMPHKEVNPHYPNCHLEFNAISEQARTIAAGSYAVVRTERRHAPLASLAPVQVAALGWSLAAISPSGSPTINYETQFFLTRLEGGAEDVRSLNCAQWGEPGSIDTYPTVDEIATALGAAGELRL